MATPRKSTHPVRLKDVAAHAGVSVATVSAVVRNVDGGSVRVGPETRRRVEHSARHLGYRPNHAARSLRTKRTGMIGVVVPDITNPLFPQFIRAAQLRAERDGVAVMIWDSCRDPRRERAAIDAILDRQLDGAVLVTEQLTIDDLEPLLAAGIAVAATDSTLDDDRIDLVSEALHHGAVLATLHLIARGHRRIGHIAGDRNSAAGYQRETGFRDAMATAGLPVDEALVTGGHSFERSAGRDAMAQLLDLDVPPTAVLASNDVLAIGAMRACAERNRSIPGDIALVGIDNSPEAEVASPALTTMDVRPAEVSERLVEIVIGRLAQTIGGPAIREIVTPTLVPRAST